MPTFSSDFSPMRVKDFNIFIAIEQECQHVAVAHILELFLLLLGCQTVGEKELNGGKQGGIVVKTAADYQHLRIRSRRPFAKRYSNQPVYILLFEHVVGFRTSFLFQIRNIIRFKFKKAFHPFGQNSDWHFLRLSIWTLTPPFTYSYVFLNMVFSD